MSLDLWARAEALRVEIREFVRNALQVVVVGRRGDADTQALLGVVHGHSLPDLVMSVIAPQEDLPAGHPARGKGQEAGRATAYICRGMTCSLPITDPAAFHKALADG